MRPNEMAELDRVRTTKRQARTILRRNRALLWALWDRRWNTRVEIGCPHCQVSHGVCYNCAWEAVDTHSMIGICLHQKFYGICSYDQAVLYTDADGLVLPASSEPLNSRTQHFLIGHIEWARSVLEGTWPTGGYRAIRRALRTEWKKETDDA